MYTYVFTLTYVCVIYGHLNIFILAIVGNSTVDLGVYFNLLLLMIEMQF